MACGIIKYNSRAQKSQVRDSKFKGRNTVVASGGSLYLSSESQSSFDHGLKIQGLSLKKKMLIILNGTFFKIIQ